MKSVDPGILPQSVCYSFTPSETARKLYFYPTWCGHYYCNNNYYMKRESYPPLLAMFICNGEMGLEYREEKLTATKGDVVLIDCAEPHYYFAENGLEFLYLHFDGSNAHDIVANILKTKKCIIRQKNNKQIEKLLYDMVMLYENGRIEDDMNRSMRIYRLLDLLTHSTPTKMANDIDRAIDYIQTYVGESISLDKLAEISNLSKYYFSRCFKEQTGYSPKEYIINTRIEKAKALLARTKKPIAEIAKEIGYGSSGSFINLFVEKNGVSPKQYRKEHQSSCFRQAKNKAAE